MSQPQETTSRAQRLCRAVCPLADFFSTRLESSVKMRVLVPLNVSFLFLYIVCFFFLPFGGLPFVCASIMVSSAHFYFRILYS